MNYFKGFIGIVDQQYFIFLYKRVAFGRKKKEKKKQFLRIDGYEGVHIIMGSNKSALLSQEEIRPICEETGRGKFFNKRFRRNF